VPGEAGDDRRRNVLEHLRRAGREEVSELAKQLVVSTETVRRDLKILERNGLVSRSHGSGGGGNDEQFDEVECLSRMGRTSRTRGPQCEPRSPQLLIGESGQRSRDRLRSALLANRASIGQRAMADSTRPNPFQSPS
jgi:hypothetical protein